MSLLVAMGPLFAICKPQAEFQKGAVATLPFCQARLDGLVLMGQAVVLVRAVVAVPSSKVPRHPGRNSADAAGALQIHLKFPVPQPQPQCWQPAPAAG